MGMFGGIAQWLAGLGQQAPQYAGSAMASPWTMDAGGIAGGAPPSAPPQPGMFGGMAPRGSNWADKLSLFGAGLKDVSSPGAGNLDAAILGQQRQQLMQSQQAQEAQARQALASYLPNITDPQERYLAMSNPVEYTKQLATRYAYHDGPAGSTSYFGDPTHGGHADFNPIVKEAGGLAYSTTPKGVSVIGGVPQTVESNTGTDGQGRPFIRPKPQIVGPVGPDGVPMFPQLGQPAPMTPQAPAGAPMASPAPAQPTTAFDAAYDGFTKGAEGGYAGVDGASGSPVNFGINQHANPDINVKNLTPAAARQILHDRYWVPSGAEDIKDDPGLQAIQLDTAVNMGPEVAKQMLAQSGGDNAKYIALREARYRAIAANPAQAANLPNWLARNQKLHTFADAQDEDGTDGSSASATTPAAPAVPGSLAWTGAPTPDQKTWTPDGKGNLINANGDRKKDPTAAGADGAPTGDSSLTGDAYLKTIQPARAAQVRAMLTGRMAFPTSFALKTPYWQGMIADAAQVDPEFDATKFASRAATRTAFLKGTQGQNMVSIQTLLGHVDDLNDAVNHLSNTNMPWLNVPLNAIRVGAGDTTTQASLAKMDTAAKAVASEAVRTLRGVGGAHADVQGWLDEFNHNKSTASLHSSIGELISLIGGRLDPLRAQYQAAMGPNADPLIDLYPRAAKIYSELGGDQREQARGAAAPTGPVPGAVAPATAARMPRLAPAVGEIRQGYRFSGGDPASPASWTRAQ